MSYRISKRFACAAIALVALVQPALADDINWDAPTGDWFDSTNWNPTQVPLPAGGGYVGDNAFINNGGTASADSSTASGDAEARSISVGAGDVAGGVSGSLSSDGVRVHGQFGVEIGTARGASESAVGDVTVTGADLDSGNTVSVGAAINPTVDANASGTLNVSGGDVNAPSSLNIGQVSINTADPTLDRDATALGAATVEGSVFGGLNVGVNSGGSATSHAEGSLHIINGDLVSPFFGNITIGRSSAGSLPDPGSASGSVIIDNGVIAPLPGSTSRSVLVGSAFGTGATADGSLVASGLNLGVESFRDFQIGFAGIEGQAGGTFSSGFGDLRVSEDFASGLATNGFQANSAGTATGTADFGTGSVIGVDGLAQSFSVGNVQNYGLFATGEGMAVGDVSAHGISGFDTYKIGVSEGTAHTATNHAEGSLIIGAGGIQGNADGDSNLLIGGSFGTTNNGQQFGPGGTAHGEVTVAGGGIEGINTIGVGVSDRFPGSSFGSGAGAATGSLTLGGGDVSATRLLVGSAFYQNFDNNTAPDAMPSADGTFNMVNGGTLTLSGGLFSGRFQVGSASSFEVSSDLTPDSLSSVHATGLANLTDVEVVGNATASIGTAQGFDEGESSGIGEVNVLRGSVQFGSLRVGASVGVEEIVDGSLNLTDTSLNVGESISVGSGYEARGVLNAINTDVSAGEDLFVGAFRSVIGTDDVGETRGIMTMQNGNLEVGGRAQVGAQFQGGEGELRLTNVQANVTESFRIGASSNLGALFGNGLVELNNSRLDVGGLVFADAGTLSLTDSQMNVVGNLQTEFFNSTAGDYFDGASADSEISLTRSLLNVGGEFAHGIDDILSISLDGTTRGTGYGAIDAATVNLRGGALNVDINFGLTLDDYIFDLIVSSALDGIVGDFGTLSLLGLNPNYSYTAGMVVDDLGSGATEIYRLALSRTSAVVPLPAALPLFGTGLALMGFVGWRRKRAAAA